MATQPVRIHRGGDALQSSECVCRLLLQPTEIRGEGNRWFGRKRRGDERRVAIGPACCSPAALLGCSSACPRSPLKAVWGFQSRSRSPFKGTLASRRPFETRNALSKPRSPNRRPARAIRFASEPASQRNTDAAVAVLQGATDRQVPADQAAALTDLLRGRATGT